MPLGSNLLYLRKELQELASDKLSTALNICKKFLIKDTEKHTAVLAIIADLKLYDKLRFKSFLTQEEFEVKIRAITNNAIDLFANLLEEDLITIPSNSKALFKTGSIEKAPTSRGIVREVQAGSSVNKQFGKNYLLAIAINNYRHCDKLNNAVSDVHSFVQLMLKRYNFQEENITLLKDEEANKKSIEKAFLKLIRTITPQDNFIIYFSGHGRYNEHLGGNWIPVEAGSSDNDWSDYISNDQVKNYLTRIKSFHTFLIADSCFSGSFFTDQNLIRNLANRVDTEPSRWALTSGKSEIVSDGRAGSHSPFASALLEVLQNADSPPSVMQICTLVLEKVAANSTQTPMGSAIAIPGHQGGQMVFYFREDSKSEEDNEESALWRSTTAIDSEEAYTHYYSKYKEGKYSDLAVEKLRYFKVKKSNWPSNNFSEMETVPEEDSLTDFSELINYTFGSQQMILVKGGVFSMDADLKSQAVRLSDFLIAEHQLTFDEYDAFCQATDRELPNDWGWGRDKRPVINISWYEAVEYCNWRSIIESLTPAYEIDEENVTVNWQVNGYRLPTEAEWEYAARGGSYSRQFLYAGGNELAKLAWYMPNSQNMTHPVGQKEANELGLYDMNGNVWEWCWDWHNADSNPRGGPQGIQKVIKGGAWDSPSGHFSGFFSHSFTPDRKHDNIGFRLARSIITI